MIDTQPYDVAIIGGGLAGLALSIQLRNKGHNIILFEKEQYPFHKVCGEYISLESWNFLKSLGIPLDKMNLPVIKKLVVSAPGGNYLQQNLPLGGFGISRYTLDNLLKGIAADMGISILENCKVDEVFFNGNQFELTTNSGKVISNVCCGSFGKRSNIDVKLKRSFIVKKSNKLNNYVGVKYHIKTDHPQDTIALHNFENGYCGISKIEDDKYCLCYLTNAANLKNNNNSITDMEQNVLYKNRHLKKIFTESEILYPQPVTISQISFEKKTQVEDHILMLGDAAGMITPLCGNGMSMALQSGKIAGEIVHKFIRGEISRNDMEQQYIDTWQKTFAKRLRVGRVIQSMFGKTSVTNIFIYLMKRAPGITTWLIKKTHGSSF